MYIAVNGGWCSWRSSGSCSKSCGTGSQERVRSCTCPSPKHGGSSCSGSSIGYRDCNTQCCPGEPQHQNFHSIFTHHLVKYVDACFHARRLQLLVWVSIIMLYSCLIQIMIHKAVKFFCSPKMMRNIWILLNHLYSKSMGSGLTGPDMVVVPEHAALEFKQVGGHVTTRYQAAEVGDALDQHKTLRFAT